MADSKFQMTPCTIPRNINLLKVVVKSSHGFPDIKVLPLGVFSLAGLHPDGRKGSEKVAINSMCHP